METRQNYLTSRFNQVQVGDVFVEYIQQTMVDQSLWKKLATAN